MRWSARRSEIRQKQSKIKPKPKHTADDEERGVATLVVREPEQTSSAHRHGTAQAQARHRHSTGTGTAQAQHRHSTGTAQAQHSHSKGTAQAQHSHLHEPDQRHQRHQVAHVQ